MFKEFTSENDGEEYPHLPLKRSFKSGYFFLFFLLNKADHNQSFGVFFYFLGSFPFFLLFSLFFYTLTSARNV